MRYKKVKTDKKLFNWKEYALKSIKRHTLGLHFLYHNGTSLQFVLFLDDQELARKH